MFLQNVVHVALNGFDRTAQLIRDVLAFVARDKTVEDPALCLGELVEVHNTTSRARYRVRSHSWKFSAGSRDW